MTRKARRRLDLQLPEDHPIFSYPKGVRSAVAREWLDIGARLANIDKNINEIKEKLNELEQKPENDGNSVFDAGTFAESLEKIFG
ncbi:MAG: hypothetical protein WBI48_03735 [Thermacetogeniaceae bacterium]